MRNRLLGVVVIGGCLLAALSCKTTDRWLGRNKHSGDDKTQTTTEDQKYAVEAQFCEQKEKKIWHRELKQCLTAQDYCVAQKDGSLWVNGHCLSPEQQCLINDGKWEGKQCKSPQQLCQEKPGHVWRNTRCLSSKEACLAQDKNYRYKWSATSGDEGECKVKTFLDFCQAGSSAPSDVQYTVSILKRLADKGDSCMATHQWLSDTIVTGHSLDLYDTNDAIKIKDLSPLMDYRDLQELRLTNNAISDLTPLAELKNLRVLDLQNNQVESLDGISGLANLQTLYLGHNRVSNLAPLQKLTALTKLHLFDNRVNDVSPLAGLVNLQVLHLKTNAISNIAPLRNLRKLQELELGQNPLMSAEVVKTPSNCPVGEGVSTKVAELCARLQNQ